MRRVGGGVPAGGGSLPAIQQQTLPSGSLATGGPNVPSPTGGPLPSARPNQLPSQSRFAPASSATPAQSVAGVAQTAQGFPDEETRKIAKTLLTKLVQFL